VAVEEGNRLLPGGAEGVALCFDVVASHVDIIFDLSIALEDVDECSGGARAEATEEAAAPGPEAGRRSQ